MASFIQPSFAKGELGPALYGRVDTAAYQVALRTARNLVIHSHGGASNRAGLQFIAPVKDHDNRPVLLDFQFKATDTYVLEFGNLYMRVIRNDAQVLEAAKTITGATSADPVVITATSHGYSDGDTVYITDVGGMTEINNRWFIVANKATHTFELTDPYDGGSDIDGSGYTTYTSGGSSGKVYELVTPYAQADLPELNWTQSADVMTIVHSEYTIRELSRTDHNAWTLTEPTFAPSITAPAGVAVTVNGANNGVYWKYKITAIKQETFEESLAGRNGTGLTVVSATAADPVVVTLTGHGLLTGDDVEMTGWTEMTEVNDRRFFITKIDANSFSLDGEDGSGYAAETTGGANTCYAAFDGAGTAAAPTGTTVPDNTITWTAVEGAAKYTIYRAKGGAGDYGFLAETNELTYTDDTTAETLTDLGIQPPVARNPFLLEDTYPGAVGYYQQRRVFGGSIDAPDTSYYTQTGNQSNMSTSRPARADDAITATLNARQVNQIRHYVPGSDLLIFTDGSEWRVNSGDNSGFAADTLRQTPQTSWGASFLKPIVVGKTHMYVQENNIAVRSLGYQLNIDGYIGTDLNLLAPHIFDSTTAVSWGYSRSPDPLTHIVRADGTAAVMTFNQEQEVLAWARWDTLGKFEWTVGLRPSATEVNDAAYFVVKRTINGNTVRFIERIASRRFTEVEDAFFVDSGLTLDSPVTISGSTAADPVVITATSHGFSDGDEIDIEGMEWTPQFDEFYNETQPDQLNGRRYYVADGATHTFALMQNENGALITGITQANPGVVTAVAHGFSDGDIIGMHGIVGMTEANDNSYKVANATADTFELNTAGDANVNTTGFTAYTNGGSVYHMEGGSAFAAYVEGGNAREAFLTISGLWHLEGETISILADGNVVEDKVVSSGSVTLDEKASRVHAGLKYIADLETLNVEAPDGTIQGRPKKLPKVTVRFQASRGLLAGPTTDQLVEMKQREYETMGSPTQLLTGDKEITLTPAWNSNGRLFLRQINPLPMTILAVIPDITVGAS